MEKGDQVYILFTDFRIVENTISLGSIMNQEFEPKTQFVEKGKSGTIARRLEPVISKLIT